MKRQSVALMAGMRPGNLQFHVHHQLRRYDSDEDLRRHESRHEKSYFVTSPASDYSDSGFIYDDDAKEFTKDDDMSPPSENLPVLEEDFSMDCNRPISIASMIASMKHGNVATYVPSEDHHDDDNDNDNDYDDIDEMAPSTPDFHSPLLLPQTCFSLPESPKGDTDMISYYQSLYRNSISDDGPDTEGEILEATQIMYIAPPSRPCLVSIQYSSTESTLTARMGRPVSQQYSLNSGRVSRQTSRGRFERERSRKMSSFSTPSPSAYSPERSKLYTNVRFRDPFGEEEASHSQTDSRTASPVGQAHRSRSSSREVAEREPQQTERGRRPRASTSASSRPVPEMIEMTREAFFQQESMLLLASRPRAWTGYHRPHSNRSWSDHSIRSVSTVSSTSSKWSAPPATNHSSATSLPLSSGSEQRRWTRHSRFNSSETDPRSECPWPVLTNTNNTSYSPRESIDSGSPRSEGVVSYPHAHPHLKGQYRLSVVTASLEENEHAEATTNREIDPDLIRPEYYKQKSFMGIRFGRKRRGELS
jgi:hypothetical protein